MYSVNPRTWEIWPAATLLCANARGAIAHGRQPGRQLRRLKTVTGADLFGKYGVKALATIGEIKNELMMHCPVVSVAFSPRPAGRFCPVVIVGWKMLASGQAWLVHDPSSNTLTDSINISTGQFKIDEIVLAPTSSFNDEIWQHGPYVFADFSPCRGWLTWEQVVVKIDRSEFEALVSDLGSIHKALVEKKLFEVVHKKKRAKSRKAVLRDITFDEEKKLWELDCDFIS